MEKADYYLLYYHRICSMINNNKSLAADNTVLRTRYDRLLLNEDLDLSLLIDAHYCLAYCLLAEKILSRRMKHLIYNAFVNYTPNTNLADANIAEHVNINKILSDFYPKMTYLSHLYKKGYKHHLIRDDEKKKIIKNLSHILTVLLTYSSNEADSKIIIAYLPAVIISFMINFPSIKISSQYNEETASEMAEKLTEPKKIIQFQNNNKADRNCDKSILAYAISVLYNCVMNCCTHLNFPISFLWFERKIGAYQFYFTTQEYMDIINIISCYEPLDKNAYIDISFPCLICKELVKNAPDIPVDIEELQYILEVNDSDIAYTYIKVKNEPLANESDFDIIDHFIEEIRQRKDLSKYIKSNNSNSAWRFLLLLTQFMYNHDLFYEKSTLKNRNVIKFRCRRIISDEFDLVDAQFTGLHTFNAVSEKYFDCFESPKSFYNVYPTTSLLNKKPIKLSKAIKRNATKKIASNQSAITGSKRKIRVKYRYDATCKGVCILDNISADTVIYKGNNTGETIPSKIYPNTLHNAKFQGLYIQSDINSNDSFSNNRFYKLFCEFNKANFLEPIVFLGLNYYLNDNNLDISIIVKNIANLYLSGAVFFSGHCVVPELHNYNDLVTKLNNYVIEIASSVSDSCVCGICSSGSVSGSCVSGSCSSGGSVSASCK